MLSAKVSVTGGLGPKTASIAEAAPPHFHIVLAGLTAREVSHADERLLWYQRGQAVPADRITIEILTLATKGSSTVWCAVKRSVQGYREAGREPRSLAPLLVHA